MVQGKEVKEDVFAGFGIDLEVRDNFDKLKEDEVDQLTKAPPQFVGTKAGEPREDVFAQFKISDIVKQNEQNRQSTGADEKAAAEAAAAVRNGNSSPSAGRKNLLRRASLLPRLPNKNNLDRRLQSERFTASTQGYRNENGPKRQRQTTHDPRLLIESERFVASNDRYQGKPKLQSGRFFGGADNETIAPKRNPVRGVSALLGPKQRVKQTSDLKALFEEESVTQPDDIPTQISFPEDAVAARPRLSDERDNRGNGAHNVGAPDGAVAAAQGAVAPSAGEELLDSMFRLEKPDNDIFADFDLDAIVRDYEALQRKIEHAPRNDNNTGRDKEPDEIENYATTYRYRNLKQMWLDNFPRLHGIIFRILIPTWILLGITVGLGYLLATYEEENEYENNNAVMVNKFLVEEFPFQESLNILVGLPTACFELYILLKMNQTNATIPPPVVDLLSWIGEDLPKVPPLDNSADVDVEVLFEEIGDFVGVCESIADTSVTALLDYANFKPLLESVLESSLTFDWVRCWDTEIYGAQNPFRPSKEQISAANNQSSFYAATWDANRLRLLNYYLEEFDCANTTCRIEAHDRSLHEATGSDMCAVNNGASAWFWFIVMTTVGYGNQSPVTMQGRVMVGCLGWISIICWGVVLVVAGKVAGIIFDDIFRRCHMRFLTGEVAGSAFLGLVGCVWILVMAMVADGWWHKRLEDYDGTPQDAMWWSYISLLTVGLGDYFLEPELLFYSDVGLWSFMFLTGFTFLSTFLNKFARLCEGYFPDSGEALKERIRNTQLVGIFAVEYKQKNQAALENIGKLVKKMDDDGRDQVVLRATRIRLKKELLVHLLYQTEEELDHFTSRGEQYESHGMARVCREENMLQEILERTTRERERLSRYRDGVPVDAPADPRDLSSRESSIGVPLQKKRVDRSFTT